MKTVSFIGDLPRLVSIVVKVLLKTENRIYYILDFLKLKKGNWVINSGDLKLKLRANSVDRWVATENFIIDEYELRKWKDITFDTVVDLGANIGAATVAMAKKFPKAKILSIEPEPDNFSLLVENIKLNNLEKKVETINAAVTESEKQEITLYLNENFAASSTTIQSSKPSVIVKNINIKKLKNRVKGKTLLKMDIEGGEMMFFKDQNLDVLKLFDSLMMEYHNISKKINGDVIEKFLKKHGITNYRRTKHFFFIHNLSPIQN